jgi:glucose-6-phosphate isomerase
LDPACDSGDSFQKHNLTFGLVLLPPMRVGMEFVKTHGHYHSSMPGSTIGFPEVYSHYFGDLYLYMQRRSYGSTGSLDDCILHQMKPGHSIMIPPGYAHVLINPSTGPALMGGLYSPNAVHDYGPIREMRGAAYYFVEDSDLEGGIPNLHYEAHPPLRRIEDPSGTRFAPPDTSRPLWLSFTTDPQRYAFITDPELAKALFVPEDQTL